MNLIIAHVFEMLIDDPYCWWPQRQLVNSRPVYDVPVLRPSRSYRVRGLGESVGVSGVFRIASGVRGGGRVAGVFRIAGGGAGGGGGGPVPFSG